LLKIHELFLRNLARLDSIEIIEDSSEPPPCATALLGAMKILVPMAGLIDVAAERRRLEKNRGKAEAESRKVEAKLGNDKFLNNAPDAVVAREKSKFEALRQAITQLDEQISRLNELG
jgi:valyl-tRNA synthetase